MMILRYVPATPPGIIPGRLPNRRKVQPVAVAPSLDSHEPLTELRSASKRELRSTIDQIVAQ